MSLQATEGELSRALKWLPVLLVCAGLVATAAVMQFQIDVNVESIDKNTDQIEISKNIIIGIQQKALSQSGDTRVELQELRGQQQVLEQKLDVVITLLKEERK